MTSEGQVQKVRCTIQPGAVREANVVTAAGDRRMRRRGGKRQGEGSTPVDVGTALRRAREASAIGLTEVHDRTGTPWQLLEALEAGDLSRFPDLRSARTAVRRYADLMELDADEFTKVTEEHWGGAASKGDGGADGGRTNGGRHPNVYATESMSVGHLSRYPGDGTHLRAFTQTDEVPGVGRADLPTGNGHNGSGQWSITGAFPATPAGPAYVRPAPVLLRGAIWVTASLLVVALCALAVQHYQPQWLADLHIVRHPLSSTPTTSGAPASGAPTPGAPARSALVTLTDTGAGSATVSVRAANYTVRVGAWAPCWTEVHTSQSFSPVFAATLQAGQLKDFNTVNGNLSVSLSAAHVTVQVRIGGKTVPKWVFTPSSVPFTLNFNSIGGS
jgi:hypothetical protein